MQRILVIGASGLIGKTAMRLGAGRYEMIGTYNTDPRGYSNLIKLDANNKKEILNIMAKIKPDLVLDTHAISDVDYCELHPDEAWNTNVESVKNVAEASKVFGAKYAFISTDYVFDGRKSEYGEKDKPHPINYYGKTKLAAELILQALDINCIITRTAVVYGNETGKKPSFVQWVTERLRRNEKTNVVIDQYNNPTFADSLVEVIFRLFDLDKNGTFHVTGKECISRYEFAKAISRKFSLNEKLLNPITTAELNQVARRPEKLNMKVDKVERITGIKMLNVNEGLDRLIMQMGK